ncbi:MAG: DUF5320 domain-containing protein [Dehalobacterium sp.]
MPGRDGSGPLGMGPMTGRGMGFCRNGARRNGAGCGFGAGKGKRSQGLNEIPSLRRQKAMLQAQVEDVNRRIEDWSEEEK